jgi:biopolymer transport protein ExbD
MRRYSQRVQPWKDEEALNITPLLDVVFIILIFFVVASAMAAHQTRMDLAEAVSGSPLVDEPLRVEVLADGQVRMEGRFYSPETLAKALVDRPSRDEAAVLVQADAEASVQALVSVLDVLRQAGYQKQALATVPR